MIKTWLLPVSVLTLVTIILLTTNAMVFIDSIILANYLKQKSKALLADSFVSDVFESFDTILDRSVYSSEGNCTALKQVLEEEIGEFMKRVLEAEEFFNERGVLINFNYTISYTENCLIEIDIKAHVKDSEGLFSFERTHRVNRMLHREQEDS